MSKNKETIADIVAEMRDEGHIGDARRIEASHFRECEALREERNRAGLAEREKLAPRIRELEAGNARLRAALKNTVDVLNAVGPLVLKHDETCIITLGVGCAINNAKRALKESEAKE